MVLLGESTAEPAAFSKILLNKLLKLERSFTLQCTISCPSLFEKDSKEKYTNRFILGDIA